MKSQYKLIPLTSLYVSECNVRKTDIEIKTLAEDITMNGLTNPLSVRAVGDKYEIYAGQRRYKAIQMLKWIGVPCMVREGLTERSMKLISLSENFQRKRMTVEDKCNAIFQVYRLNKNSEEDTYKVPVHNIHNRNSTPHKNFKRLQ